jgi:flagellar assembly protein FliH
LRKIIKSSNTDQVNTFRLHYFPNIPASHAEDGGISRASGALCETEPSESRASSAEDQLRRQQAEIEHTAYETGFRKGEQDGRAAARQQAEPLMATLKAILAELDGVRSRIRQHMEREVVELALHVARKVIHHELSVSEDAILRVVKDAMGHLQDPGNIAIRLNPEDLKRIRDTGDGMQAFLGHHENVQFEEDSAIDCGGCYIQTDYGEIDARIEEQLRHIEETFRAEMRHTASEDQ